MTYTGQIRRGVVVLKDAPALEEGTIVRVEVTSSPRAPRRGNAEAVLSHAGAWKGCEAEMDEALEYLRQSKQAEMNAKQAMVHLESVADVRTENLRD